MENFTTVDDFIGNQAFIEWVTEGTHQAFWQQFIEENPEKLPLILAAQKAISIVHKAEKRAPLDSQATWNRIQKSIHQEENKIPTNPPRKTVLHPYFLVSFALFTFAMLITFWVTNQDHPVDLYTTKVEDKRNQTDFVEYSNTNTTPRIITLPDNSKVLLYQNSQMSFNSTSFRTEERTIYLKGKAKFEVAKIKNRPFTVFAGELTTKVLGTIFTISAFEEEREVTVNVSSGSVSVSSQSESLRPKSVIKETGVVLQPNQEVIFDRTASHFTKKIVAEPQPLYTASKTLESYEEISVTSLFELLQAIYGIEIRYNAQDLSTCLITTNLKGLSFQEALDVICTTLGISYTIMDAQIVLNPGNCQNH